MLPTTVTVDVITVVVVVVATATTSTSVEVVSVVVVVDVSVDVPTVGTPLGSGAAVVAGAGTIMLAHGWHVAQASQPHFTNHGDPFPAQKMPQPKMLMILADEVVTVVVVPVVVVVLVVVVVVQTGGGPLPRFSTAVTLVHMMPLNMGGPRAVSFSIQYVLFWTVSFTKISSANDAFWHWTH